jgi:hypothetical protein
MILVTFSHPLTSNQITQAEALTHQTIDQVISLPVRFDIQQPFLPQLEASWLGSHSQPSSGRMSLSWSTHPN